MLESLTHGGGENVPGIPGACATRNFTYLVRGPWDNISQTRTRRLVPHELWHAPSEYRGDKWLWIIEGVLNPAADSYYYSSVCCLIEDGICRDSIMLKNQILGARKDYDERSCKASDEGNFS